MWSSIWHTFFFDPVYNSLVFFIDVLPGGDVGFAIVCTVVLVKVVLLPLSLKAVRTQHAMRQIEPQMKELKEKFKDNREQMAREMMQLYRDANVNPFTSIALLFIQIPIVIALYLSVSNGGGVALPEINVQYLYSFIPTPETVSMLMFGLFDITERSLPLAAAAGVFQFMHGRLAMPPLPPRDPNAEPNFKDDFSRSMQLQMKYVMPVVIFIFAYTLSAAIALYFAVSSLMSVGQELLVQRKKGQLEANSNYS